MDGLYDNAWGETSGSTAESSDFASSSSATWSTPKLAVPLDEEVDLAAPSWSTGPDVRWNEESNDAQGFAWSSTDPDLAWAADTYSHTQTDSGYETAELSAVTEDTKLQRQTEEQLSSVEEISAATEELPASRSSSPLSDRQDDSQDDVVSTDVRPSSPEADTFGTFETATFDAVGKQHVSNIVPDVDADTWGSPWVAEQQTEENNAPVDEWEMARQQKEKLDKKIPPEVLVSVVAQCTEYCREAWPHAVANQPPGEEEWMNSWKDGLESLDGLDALMRSIVPELTLQPPTQFSKTTMAKSMASAVRSTKNLPLSRTSPLSHYLAARGSTAWEIAVKERKVVEEDVVPVGWRILEKKAETSPVEPTKSARQSGLFSFWSRRQSKPPSAITDSPREQSLSSSHTPNMSGELVEGLASARASVDSIKPHSAAKGEKTSSPAEFPSSSSPTIPETSTAASPSNTLYSEAPDTVSTVPTPPPQAASAVSRFLNRFSRRRSTVSTHNEHSSFALSSDDLEFLSDIVPSAQDGMDEDLTDPKELSNVLKPEPLPPILPPPPSAAPVIRPTSTTPMNFASPPSSTPLIANLSNPQSAKPSLQTQALDDSDFFGSFESSPVPAISGSKPLAADVPSDQSVQTLSSNPQLQTLFPLTTGRSFSTRSSSPPSIFSSHIPPPKKPVSQHIYLAPPPPPSSRPRTPLVATTSPGSPSVEPSNAKRTRSPTRKPKVSLSFTIPSPSAGSPVPSAPPTASSVISTQSEVPLGELYPHAVIGAASTLNSAASRPFSPPGRSTLSPPLLAPPPGSSKPLLPKPLETSNMFDHDDDFADFQSSTTSPLQEEPPLPNPPREAPKSSFTLPPPPSLRPTPLSSLPSLRPPSSTAFGSGPSSPQPQSSDPFTDDFSSFLSSTSTSGLNTNGSHSTIFGFAPSSANSLLTPQKPGRTGFEEGDPSSSALRTPSPPRVPSKSPRHTQESVGVIRSAEKKVKVSEHLHTLNLMERAAARPGQWPAPPSPLPQALEFPALSPPPKSNIDLLSDEDSFGTFQSDNMAPSSSSSTLLNPSRQATLSPPPPSASQSYPVLSQLGGSRYSTLHASSSSSNSVSKAGGLSAQDLSFFEGL